jgi:hypothetical protein
MLSSRQNINASLDVLCISPLPLVLTSPTMPCGLDNCGFSSKPTHFHMLAAKHILRYLGGSHLLELSLSTPSTTVPPSLTGYIQNMGCSDADWALDASDRKSISGYLFFFQGSLISWSSVKQKSIALSSTEVEYYAMTHAFKEALWLQVFLGFLKFPVCKLVWLLP